MKNDFITILKYKSTEEGGRKTPAASGYRPHLKFEFSDYLTSGQQTFIGADIVCPGQEVLAEIKLVTPKVFAYRLEKGTSFQFAEGARIIGTGIVTEVLNQTLLRNEWMYQNAWKDEIKKFLEGRFYLDEVSAYLRLLKARGISQQDVAQHLYSLRACCQSEEQEDRILEILDVVEGWCNSKYQVW